MDYLELAISYGWKVIVVILATWGVSGAIERIGEITLHRRIKAALPLALSIAIVLLLPRGTEMKKDIIDGIVIGSLSSTAYDLLIDKIIKAFEGVISKITDKAKSE